MKYYWIASTIEIKTVVLPCREINTKIVIFDDFKSFQAIFMGFKSLLVRFIDFQVILLIIFTIFLGHQNPGPGDQHYASSSLLMSTFLIRTANSQTISHPIALTSLGAPCSRPNPLLKLSKCWETKTLGIQKGVKTGQVHLKREAYI